MALIKEKPSKIYLSFKNGKMFFNENLKNEIFQKGFFSKIISSFVFSNKVLNVLNDYDPKPIEEYYNKYINYDYFKIDILQKKKIFEKTWELLVENFKYVLVADLIQQYNLKVEIPEIYNEDLESRRYNYIYLLNEKKISFEKFNLEFGFLAKSDYDFSCKRYSECKKIVNYLKEMLVEKKSENNFRIFIKYKNIKLIALIRKILLSFNDKLIFDKYKEDLFSEKKSKKKIEDENEKIVFKNNIIKISKKKRISKNKSISKNMSISKIKDTKNDYNFIGKTFNGKGIIRGKVRIINSINDYKKVKKGEIILTENLSPDLVVLFPIIGGIVSERGGLLSHAVIVAKERNIPILAQVKNVCSSFKNGDEIEVDLNKGRIILM